MIKRPTTLILGAGASSHAGYPLGSRLISDICSKKFIETIELPSNINKIDAQNFIKRLGRSGHYSIDAFLADATEQMELGKYLIASALKKYEELDNLFPPNNSGWYQYLFNQLLTNNKPELENNQLSIITFNYDRSLEAYIHTALMNRFSINKDQATHILNKIPIVHVHGILGEFPKEEYSKTVSPEKLYEISGSIKIIHELKDQSNGFCTSEFEITHELLKRSDRIFFMGFGFHRDNLSRFKFFNPRNTQDIEIKSTTFGMQQLDHIELPSKLKEFVLDKEVFPVNSANCEIFFPEQPILSKTIIKKLHYLI